MRRESEATPDPGQTARVTRLPATGARAATALILIVAACSGGATAPLTSQETEPPPTIATTTSITPPTTPPPASTPTTPPPTCTVWFAGLREIFGVQYEMTGASTDGETCSFEAAGNSVSAWIRTGDRAAFTSARDQAELEYGTVEDLPGLCDAAYTTVGSDDSARVEALKDSHLIGFVIQVAGSIDDPAEFDGYLTGRQAARVVLSRMCP